MKWLLVLCFVVLCSLLTACSEQMPPELVCDKQYNYAVFSPDEEELYKYHQTVPIVFQHTQDDMFRVTPDIALYDEVLVEQKKLNRLTEDFKPALSAVFATSPALMDGSWYHHWWYTNDARVPQSTHYSYIEEICAQASITLRYRLGVEYSNSYTQYKTYLRYVGDLVYVKIVSPGGSFVQYSFPQRLMTQALRQALGGERDDLLKEPISLGSTPELSEQKFAEAILAASVGQAHEVASIQIATSDFEGRKELWPVISKALELATKQNPEATFVMLAKMSTNASAAAQITYSQSDFHVTGWKAMFAGGVEGSGGGASGKGSYNYSMSQVVEATIILVEP